MILATLILACGPDPEAVAAGIVSPNPATRRDMVVVARNAEGEEVVQALVSALADPSADIRLTAVQSLQFHADPASVPALVAALADPDPRVRSESVDALGMIGDSRAAAPLIEYLGQSERVLVPLNALWALGAIGDPVALPLLSELALVDDPYVSYNANWALRQLQPAGS